MKRAYIWDVEPGEKISKYDIIPLTKEELEQRKESHPDLWQPALLVDSVRVRGKDKDDAWLMISAMQGESHCRTMTFPAFTLYLCMEKPMP